MILLVEDNPSDVKHILRALKELNIPNEIVVLEDGADALDYIMNNNNVSERAPLECVFLDLKLPNVDGLEILRQLRTQERTRLIPVVIFTSSREASDVLNSYELGANSFVCKPIDADEFTLAIQQTGIYWLQRNEGPPVRK
jgi:two-component system, response regulator